MSTIDIFNKRWHGIKGETVGEGKYAMSVVRIQTTDQGPWQALTQRELDLLLIEHNKNIHKDEKLKGPYKSDPVGKVIRDAVRVKSKKKAKKK